MNYEVKNGKLIFDCDLESVTSLNISYNQEIVEIPELPNLMLLDAYGCTALESLPEMPNLMYLDASCCTKLKSLPEMPNLKKLYICEKTLLNVGYATGCGNNKRTIFAIKSNNTIKIAAGCFFDTFDEFCKSVDTKYEGQNAVEYKQKASEAIAMLNDRIKL